MKGVSNSTDEGGQKQKHTHLKDAVAAQRALHTPLEPLGDAAAVVEDPAGGENADEGDSREEISGVGNTPELRKLFDQIDTDGGGSLDRSEIEQLCKKMGVFMTDGV